ncbi:MAG TPA: shikimate dehydrogenase [Lacibacter sp.]|nr:shikimate dehydrogenase [Lacibacter sp.]HMO89367.1 shikimate dehydrogenase [Lacibacter sp.]HMP88223.1 shikimate dehydrogenase [Lacibacter sp.]
MRLFGLIGYPLSHSFSARYFAEKFRREQIAGCAYELFPLTTITGLPELIRSQPVLEGLNVTIPYKEQVLPYLTRLSAAVQEIGACNCIRIYNGQLTGYNTDVIGFEQMLVPLLQPQDRQALVLGTGGAAKAVAWVLRRLGIGVRFVSRSEAPGLLRYEDLSPAVLEQSTVLVNTTPLGMQPAVHLCPSVPMEWITPRHLCIDLIYNPEKTVFLTAAQQRGARICNGMPMLEIQAEESWKIWNSSS